MKWVKIPTKEGNALVPYSSITAIVDAKDYNGSYTNVYVKNLELYTVNRDMSTRPDLYIPINGVEVIKSTVMSEELLFLLNIGSTNESNK